MPEPVTDIAVEQRSDWGRQIAWLFVSATIVAIVAGSLGGRFRAGSRYSLIDNLSIIAMALSVYIPFIIRHYRIARRVRAVLANGESGDVQQTLRDAYAAAAWRSMAFATYGPLHRVMCDIAETARERGLTGVVIRFHRPERPPDPVTPFASPLEPTLLRERDESFQATFGIEVDRRQRMREGLDAAANLFGLGKSWRRAFLILGVGAWLIGIATFAVRAIPSLLRGEIPGELLFVIALALGLLAWTLFYRREWLLTQGAILVRVGKPGAAKWRLSRFTRYDSVIVYSADFNIMAIAGESERVARMLSPREANAAMSAWLSPLLPPRIEQLAELHGDTT